MIKIQQILTEDSKLINVSEYNVNLTKIKESGQKEKIELDFNILDFCDMVKQNFLSETFSTSDIFKVLTVENQVFTRSKYNGFYLNN
jgi:hypothetical protein